MSETIEDIIREMRDWWMRSDNEEADAELASFANRIEEAWEIKLIAEKAKAAAEGYVQGQQSVTDCNQPKDVPTTEKSSQVGNAAAMREALDAINRIDTRGLNRLLYELVEADIFDGGQINKTISSVDKAKAALSAPPRNCDKYMTPKDAMLAHLDEVYQGEKVEFGDYEWCEFIKWLFAEAKGKAK